MSVRIAHLIVGLDIGGAERMLLSLLQHRDASNRLVVTMTDGGALLPDVRETGARVVSLGMRRGLPDPRAFRGLKAALDGFRPAVLQTWMYHADLLGGLAAGSIPVVWSVHAVDIEREGLKASTRLARSICARLSSRLPRRIVYCAASAERFHTSIGYAKDRSVVIPNGVDTDRFAPDDQARDALLDEIGEGPDTEIVGLVARFHPQKDHQTFARAAARLASRRPHAHFVLCGRGVHPGNPALTGWLHEEGVLDRCHLLGERLDTSRLLAALDVATLSSSFGEASPMVVMEAMACGTRCVVTDVGDSAAIVGDSGIVVPPKDAQALADAWERSLGMSSAASADASDRARKRILERFSIAAAAGAYDSLYEEITR